METKTCPVYNIEKYIKNFHKKYSKCKDCNIKRGVKGYFDNKDEISIQQKLYYEKKTNFYSSKMITKIKETQTLKNYIDPMLN